MSKFKKDIKMSNLILVIIILILIIVSLLVYIKMIYEPNKRIDEIKQIYSSNNTTYSNSAKNTSNKTTSKPATDEETVKYLATLGERDRMQFYCGKFFDLLYKGEYEKAYSLLNSDFKNNYFQTLEDFQKYIETAFPKMYAIDYDDIERQGNIYILRLKIYNLENIEKQEEAIQRVVVYEKYYNNYEISFQVKK